MHESLDINLSTPVGFLALLCKEDHLIASWDEKSKMVFFSFNLRHIAITALLH